jgi:predicted membrane protein
MGIKTVPPRKGLIIRLHAGGVAFGLSMVGLGIVLLLGQMGLVSTTYLFHFFWPAVMIFVGLECIFSQYRFNKDLGVFLTLAGIILFFSKLGYLHFSFSIVWPLACIYWGIWIVARTFGIRNWWESKTAGFAENNVIDVTDTDPNRVPADISAVFGSFKRPITVKNFKGAKLEAIFGEVAIDLTKAELAGDEVTVHADAIFGACEIRVPETWQILVRGSAVMGEYVDKTHQRPPDGPGVKTLIVVGSAVFGTVEVKN